MSVRRSSPSSTSRRASDAATPSSCDIVLHIADHCWSDTVSAGQKVYVELKAAPCNGAAVLQPAASTRFAQTMLAQPYRGEPCLLTAASAVQVPDVDAVIQFQDLPAVPVARSNASAPLFCYASNDMFLDVPFPGWSYWGNMAHNQPASWQVSCMLSEANLPPKLFV